MHGPSSREEEPNPERTPTPRKRNPRNRALWNFFTLEDQATAPDPKNLRKICKRWGFPCQRKQGSPTGMKSHLQRKHFALYKQFKEYEVEFSKQKVIVN